MNGGAASSRRVRWILASVALLLPFEPRRPIWSAAGLQFTLLETIAGLALLLLALSLRRRLPALLARPPLPVLALGAFASIQLLAAALAPTHRGSSAVFSLRMVAVAALAALVSACRAGEIRWVFRGLAIAAVPVAVLAVLEGLGNVALDPFLDLFRPAAFFAGAARRASAASENPNLAAALLGHGLVAGVGLLSAGRTAWHAPTFALLPWLGLLFTYSRGGLVAAIAALCVLTWCQRGTRGSLTQVLPLAVLAVVAAGFALQRPQFLGRFFLEMDVSSHRARYEPADGSLRLEPGETRCLSVRVTNSGVRAWRVQDGFRLGCTWFDTRRFSNAGCRTPVAALAPGESLMLSTEVRAPATRGRYLLLWEMLGPRGRFSSLGDAPAAVPVDVGVPAAPVSASAIPSLVSEQSRAGLWRLAWAMWRERPLLGHGPDNFRRLHAQFAGWPLDDPLHAAHNTWLEVAATSGLSGLFALGIALVATAQAARRAWRRGESAEAREAGAITLALLTGILAHSMVDYLLGFTAHYLVLGLVVGCAVASGSPTIDQRSAGS